METRRKTIYFDAETLFQLQKFRVKKGFSTISECINYFCRFILDDETQVLRREAKTHARKLNILIKQIEEIEIQKEKDCLVI